MNANETKEILSELKSLSPKLALSRETREKNSADHAALLEKIESDKKEFAKVTHEYARLKSRLANILDDKIYFEVDTSIDFGTSVDDCVEDLKDAIKELTNVADLNDLDESIKVAFEVAIQEMIEQKKQRVVDDYECDLYEFSDFEEIDFNYLIDSQNS